MKTPPGDCFDLAKALANAVREMDESGCHPIVAANRIFHALLEMWEVGCKDGAEALRDQILTPSRN